MWNIFTVGVALSGWGTTILDLCLLKVLAILDSNLETQESKVMKEQLVKLQLVLLKIKSILSNEEICSTNDQMAKFIFRRLQDASYRAEDLVDDISLDLKKIGHGKRYFRMVTDQISNFLENTKLILDQCDNLSSDLVKDIRVELIEETNWGLRKSSTFGRDDDVNVIRGLVNSRSNNNRVSIVSIVGFTGIGKTVVAQLMYNDLMIVQDYHRIWVSINKKFDLRFVIQSILQTAKRTCVNITSIEHAIVELREYISKKKIFLVLDGAWHEDKNDWNSLLELFDVASYGSVILVTTQCAITSSVIGASYTLDLQPLSYDHCLSIFRQQAFGDENHKTEGFLSIIEEEIVKKCRGIPLFAATLGNLLFNKKQISDWDLILASDIFRLGDEGSLISYRVRSSYYHLPVELRACLFYCALFPRGYTITKEKLILLWMAENVIKPKGEVRMEDVGEICFKELVKRRFLNVLGERGNVVDDGGSRYLITDFTYDMIKLIVGDDSLIIESCDPLSLVGNEEFVRHISITLDGPHVKRFKNLRTYLFLDTPSNARRDISVSFFGELKWVRVLDLSSSKMVNVASHVSKLRFLTYLDLSNTPIVEIEKNIWDIHFLQTLDVRGCHQLKSLPNPRRVHDNFRHLYVDDTLPMPLSIGMFRKLQNLNRFFLLQYSTLGELEKLNELHDALWISRLEFLDGEHHGALIKKRHLKKLTLQWNFRRYVPSWSDNILKWLHPHRNLEQLVFKGYHFDGWGNWALEATSALEVIELNDCRNLTSVSIFKDLKFLRRLTINGNNKVEILDPMVFFGHDESGVVFPSLQSLTFTSWKLLTEWSAVLPGDMPLLREIGFIDCSKLRIVPDFNQFTLLTQLDFIGCTSLQYCKAESRPSSITLTCEGSTILQNVGGDWPFELN